ncbi:recombinase family protein [Planctomycetaceae bacterium]|nr:recombinase family protein [Planctomycetaceae bacterium]
MPIEPRTKRPKNKIPQELRSVYEEVLITARRFRDAGKSHLEVCQALNELGFRTRTGLEWRHPAQIIKLLRSFPEDG